MGQEAKAETLNAELRTSDAMTGSLFDERNLAVSRNNVGHADHLERKANRERKYAVEIFGLIK